MSGKFCYNTDLKWKDGSSVTNFGEKFISCRKGSNINENANYYYCEYLEYNNTLKNKDNIILGPKYYRISLVLNKNESNIFYIDKNNFTCSNF